MAWDGSGNYTRTDGTRTGSSIWQDARDAGVKIRADDHDTHDQDVATAINACLTQNNESKPTATFSPNADASYDLGGASAQWRNLYLSGDITGDVSNYSKLPKATITPGSDGDVTLSSSQYIYGYLVLADGSWTSGHNIIVPAEAREFYIDNSSGTYDATVKTSGGTGVLVPSGGKEKVYCDGTNVVKPITDNPAGMVAPFAMDTAPAGWLECDGSAISRTTYSGLFSAIGTRFGTGDGSTTFNIPDLRGQFVRGYDNGAGTDPDAASRTDSGDGTTGDNVGTQQADEIKSHNHQQHDTRSDNTDDSNGYTKEMGNVGTTRTRNTKNTGGNETRPTNIALMYCIKY